MSASHKKREVEINFAIRMKEVKIDHAIRMKKSRHWSCHKNEKSSRGHQQIVSAKIWSQSLKLIVAKSFTHAIAMSQYQQVI